MKRFASIFVSVLLVALMVCGTAASALSVLPDNPTTGTLTLYKYTTDSDNEAAETPATPPVNDDQKPVKDAEYTAYQIATITSNGTFVLDPKFKDVEFDGVKLSTLFKEDNLGGLTYQNTDTFQKYIPALRNKIENGSGFVSKAAKTNVDGKAVIDGLALGVYLVLETEIPNGYVESSKPFLVQLPQWDQDLKNGEGDWVFEVTAYPKDDPITITKKIIESDGESRVDETTRGIGDIVNYEVTVDVPYYSADLTPAQIKAIKYFVTDTMDQGLTFKNDVEVTIKGTTTTLKEGVDFKVSTTGTTVITIDFTSEKVYDLKGNVLVINYSATLNELALIGAANENSAKLSFTNNPSTGKVKPAPTEPATDPETGETIPSTYPTDPDTGETIPPTLPTDPNTGETIPTPTVPDTDIDETDEQDTKVYTYAFELLKKFNDGAQKPDASDVEFSIKNAEGKLEFVKLEDGKYIVLGDDFKKFVQEKTVDEKTIKVIKLPIDSENQKEYVVTEALNPASNGSLLVKGLKDGIYTLTEEKTVSGYSKLEGDVTLDVKAGKDNNDKLSGEVSATANGSVLKANAEGKAGIFEFEINNVFEQFDLPQTGGAGLLAFTIGGGIVIAGSIIMFSLLRKKRTSK